MDSFFFFVPNRLVWSHWQQFMGQQANPTDSISYVVPQQVSPAGGYTIGSLQDYMGLPTVGQVAGTNTVSHCAFWTDFNYKFRPYFLDLVYKIYLKTHTNNECVNIVKMKEILITFINNH